MSLRERLTEILPGLLPEREENAIKGKELIARVRAVLGDSYSDHSLRSQFSFMALDPESCLARVPNGQGYYLRGEDDDAPSLQHIFGSDAREGEDTLNKAMALAVRLFDTAGLGVFVYPVDGEESWEHPDLVAVQWPAGCRDDSGAYVPTPSDTPLQVAYRAVCVGFGESAESCRRAFYRALACGNWAEQTELLLMPGCDNVEELADLAALHGIGLRCIGLDEEALDSLPRADELFRMDELSTRELLSSIPQHTVAHPRRRDFSARAAASLPDTAVVLDWAQGCLSRGRVEPYEMRVAVN